MNFFLIIMHSCSMHNILGTAFLILIFFVDKDSEEESDMEEQAFPDIEEGEKEEPAESSSDQEQEDDEEDTDWAKLEDSAPSAEDYSSQSDDDTEGNDSSSDIRYIFKLSSSSHQHTCIQNFCNISLFEGQ